MDYNETIRKYIGRDFDPDDIQLDNNKGVLSIVKWNVKDIPKPTMTALNAYYNSNKLTIDTDTAKKLVIKTNRKRIIEKLVETELIKEGLL